MPTPRPIIMPTIFVMLGTSVKPANTPTAARTEEDADERGPDRQAHRDDGAERDEQHDDRDPRPIISLPGSSCSTCASAAGELGRDAGGT